MYTHANVFITDGDSYPYCLSYLDEASQCLTEYQYDACLTDLNLPDGNGLQLLQWMNEHCPSLPVAVLTAYGNMEIAIAALKAGCFRFCQQTH